MRYEGRKYGGSERAQGRKEGRKEERKVGRVREKEGGRERGRDGQTVYFNMEFLQLYGIGFQESRDSKITKIS